MILKINKKMILFCTMIIVLCEPTGISFTSFDPLFKVMKILVFLYVIFDFFLRKKINKMSPTFYCVLTFELLLVVSTILNGISLYYTILHSMTFISVFYITEKFMKRNRDGTIYALAVITLVYLFINIFSATFNLGFSHNGTTFYFLGIRTRVTDTVYLFLFAMILHINCRKKKKIKVLGLIAIILSLICFNVSTMYIGLAIFCCFSIMYEWKLIRNIIANKFFIIIIGAMIVGVVVFRLQQNFDSFFELFGKSSDLSYRTYIWDNAITKIKESPISVLLGHGITELGEWVIFEGRRWQAHNQFLQVILDGGFIGLTCFASCIFISMRECFKGRRYKKAYICCALMMSYLIIMITEIYSYYPQFYIILAMVANYDFFYESEKFEII